MKKSSPAPKFFAILLLLISAAISLLYSQAPQGFSGKKIEFPYYENLKLKAIFTGENARQVTRSKLLVTEFGMKTFRDGDPNKVELIAVAPECLIDRDTSIASSSGPIKAYTATTNLYIEGEGFYCQQTNAMLIISNKVQTVIRKGSLDSSSKEKQSPAEELLTGGTNQVLNIFSDHFQFLYESNLVTYSGNVRVEDAQMQLTCDFLNIRLGTNQSIERITAENRVVILNKKDNSRATGNLATYLVSEEKETIELTGNPIWSGNQREGRADIFKFDRTQNLFRAERNAVFKLPRAEIGQPELFMTQSATNAADDLVEISAGLFTFKLPETNGPIREISAETNVIITSMNDQSRATADRAIYNEVSGAIELTGHPVWRINKTEIRADLLAVGTNQSFAARTNVHLQMPATLFGGISQSNAAEGNSSTNQFVEIFCNSFLYTTNIATFRDNVRGKMLGATLSQTTLNCGLLEISFGESNQVKTVSAHNEVFLQQVPHVSAKTSVLKRTVTCEELTLNRSAITGLLKSIHAETNVVAEEIELLAGGEALKRISAGDINIKFSATTNQIENVMAKEKVLAERIEHSQGKVNFSVAEGEQAFYTSALDYLELTGTPTAQIDDVFFRNSTVFGWNLKTGKISARGPTIITRLNTTNDFKSTLKNFQP